MVGSYRKKIQQLAASGLILLSAGGAVYGGLFCHWCVAPVRPYMSPACEPSWGYHETCWKQFPPISGSRCGDYCPDCQSVDNAYPPHSTLAPQSAVGGPSGPPAGLVIPGTQFGQGAPYVPPAGEENHLHAEPGTGSFPSPAEAQFQPLPQPDTRQLQPRVLIPQPGSPIPVPESNLPPMQLPEPMPQPLPIKGTRTGYSLGAQTSIRSHHDLNAQTYSGQIAGPTSAAGQATPLVLNARTTKAISLSRELTPVESEPEKEESRPAYKRWLKMPRLF